MYSGGDDKKIRITDIATMTNIDTETASTNIRDIAVSGNILVAGLRNSGNDFNSWTLAPDGTATELFDTNVISSDATSVDVDENIVVLTNMLEGSTPAPWLRVNIQ